MEHEEVDHEIDDDTKSINNAVEALMIHVRFSSSFSLDPNNINMKIFITSFAIIHSSKIMTTGLANCSFDYAITGNNLDLDWHKSDLFTYITLERYTSDEFYRIVIDKRAFKRLTARDGQYLVYKKNVTPI